MWVEAIIEAEAAWLSFDDLFQIKVPDENDRNPRDWWNVEAITGIAAERVVSCWKKKGRGEEVDTGDGTNRALEDVVQLLNAEVDRWFDRPIRDIGELRRAVVRQRIARDRALAPILFVGRIELVVERMKMLLEDVYGPFLFTATNGQRLVPVMMRSVRGRAEMVRLDNEDDARNALLEAIRFARPGRTPKGVDPNQVRVPPTGATPPPIAVRSLMTAPFEWPELKGVVRIPTLRADGSIITQVGYDPETKLWFAPDPEFSNIAIPEDPSLEDMLRAREQVLECIAEFPYVDGPGGIVAALIERVCAPMLVGCSRPIYVIDATTPGTGKSLLARTVASVAVGYDVGSGGALTGREEEDEKRITALLRNGTEAFVSDNMEGTIDSNALCRLASSPVWIGRILGVSEAPAFTNNMTMLLTINNAVLSRDIVRRSVLVRLKAKDAYKRRVRWRFDLPNDAISRRARIVEGILILARGWAMRGQPPDERLYGLRGGFERWLHVVGGILWNSGIPGLFEALNEAENRDDEEGDEAAFLAAWRDTYGLSAVSTQDLVNLAKSRGLFQTKIGDSKGTWPERRMAREILTPMIGETVERIGTYKPWTWRLLISSFSHFAVPIVEEESFYAQAN